MDEILGARSWHVNGGGKPRESVRYAVGFGSVHVDAIASVVVRGWAEIEAVDTVGSPCSTLFWRLVHDDVGAEGSDRVRSKVVGAAMKTLVCRYRRVGRPRV
jgi:hypothetical protein